MNRAADLQSPSGILVATIADARARLTALRQRGAVVGLVPTMGALHEGHRRLIETARRECSAVVVSIFVNPLQFDREQDLRTYPRSMDADLEVCRSMQVDLVFAPDAAEMYPQAPRCTVAVGRLADHLCGKFRPGHFGGVATVVLKLLDIVQPDRAYFGEKDAQQLAIVRRMAIDFNVPATIVGVRTVREADGLAMSSRNQLLTPDERALAPALYRALTEARRQIERGVKDPSAVKAAATALIPATSTVRVEYFDVVDPDEMQPVPSIEGPVCVAAAMWVGKTRLIDNVVVDGAGRRD